MPDPSNEDYYALLGVKPTANASAIKRAYRKAVRKYHPDKHHGHDLEELAREKLAAINQAYDILKDPEKRRQYDQLRGRASNSTGEGPGRGPGFGAFAPPRLLRPIIMLLGIAGAGMALRFLRNPRVWIIVAVLVGIAWFVWRQRKPDDD